MATAAEKAREKFLANFAKGFGEGTAQVKDKNTYDVIPTGSVALDRALSVGGYVRGRLTEIWGPPAGGKSSLSLIAAGEAQRAVPDKDVIYVDIEHTYDPEWARTLGADPSRIIHIDPLTAENVADMAKESIRSGVASMMIFDSIGAVLTENEFEKAAGESDMGKRAQVVSRMVNISAGLAPRYNVAVIILNQARANFGYGADTKPSGGFVPAHSMSARLNVKRASSAYTIGGTDDKMNVGYEMGVKVERNKMGAEGRNVKFDFYTVAHERKGSHYAVGIDKVQEAFMIGKRGFGIVQGGSYYTFEDGEKIYTEKAAMDYLREHPKLIDGIRAKAVSDVAEEIKDDTPPELSLEQAKEAGIA